LLGGSWTIKFEEQFKVRDERDVNAGTVAPSVESQKRLRRSENLPIVKFGLPCGLAKQ
jgi:hypothetical protein